MVSVNKVLDVLIVWLLILLSGSILIMSLFNETYLLSLLLLALSIAFNRNFKKIEISGFVLILLASIVFLSCNYIFSISTGLKDYMLLFLRFFNAALTYLVLSRRIDNFLPNIQKTLNIICILSLLGLITYVLFPGIGKTIHFANGYSSITIGFFYYFHAVVEVGGVWIPRNQGLFWEPGVLAAYANFFLFLSFFYYKKRSQIILATLVIITTFSTSGLFVMALQWLFFILRGKSLKIHYKILICFVIFIPIAYVSYLSFKEKKEDGIKNTVTSYSLREFDLYSAAVIAWKYPLTGIGINKDTFLSERDKLPLTKLQDQAILKDRGNSNTLFSMFYTWGVPIALLLLLCSYCQCVFTQEKMLFFLLFVLSLMTEPLLYTPFYLLIIYSGSRNIILMMFKQKNNDGKYFAK